MSIPSVEQQAILECTARVRIVRAAPGSGKTWLVAKLIRQELDNWSATNNGIAALSFTHVGGEEIHKAVGHELAHPHFVGTIDSFLYRFVLRPFLQCCFPSFPSPRLIPGDWGAEHWGKYGLGQSVCIEKGINLFGCVFVDESQGKAVIARKAHPTQPLRPVSDDISNKIREGKKRLWTKSGCLTHSDAALWASKILEHQTYGVTIRAEIIRRFPLLIVDELQDTGYFLGKSIRLLLNESSVRGVLVGDPDQAIFEFNGARPDLFDDFGSIEGAASLSLANSRRCPRAVVQAAKHVKDSIGEIEPTEGRNGRAILVKYNDMRTDVNRIVKAICCRRMGDTIKVIARHNQTIQDIAGKTSESPPKLGCPPLNHINRAVREFRQGHHVAALAAVCTALNLTVFKHEGVEEDELKHFKIDPHDWKSLGVRCLLEANELDTSGNIFGWQTTASNIIETTLYAFNLDASLNFHIGELHPQKRDGWENPATNYLPKRDTTDSDVMDIPIQTVHSVKGETHDVTIFVCPPNSKLSTQWWSTDEKDREEKRIAYVAMTRTRDVLVLCVSEKCYHQLEIHQPQFVADFECLSVDAFVGSFNPYIED